MTQPKTIYIQDASFGPAFPEERGKLNVTNHQGRRPSAELQVRHAFIPSSGDISAICASQMHCFLLSTSPHVDGLRQKRRNGSDTALFPPFLEKASSDERINKVSYVRQLWQ
jgi:hypothetical protein